jgi:2-C-methyl-D-erythritol 4-phosphate cytidylyltransferase/2-C-methyl-D-erythritol 2,4-cyclodiphosphate synthase
MRLSVIIAAGGRGRRLGSAVPKQLLSVGGRPVLERTVEAFLTSPLVERVVVALPPDLLESPPAYLQHPRIDRVAGGERRQDSVANALDALPAGTDVVLVHDAARPFVDHAMIEASAGAAWESGAAVVALPARDTVKRSATREAGYAVIDETIPRESIYLAQTPQAFRVEVLREAVALGRSGIEVTDEAALAELAGCHVRIVEGNARNMKITTPDDMVMAEALAGVVDAERGQASRLPAEWRAGSGYDLHRLVEGRPLILGGVAIPFEKGLAGHSDADIVCHAVTDAVLGAVAAGDIGQHFPDTDPRWKGASSTELLRAVVDLVRARGYRVVNVDVTVIAERPKLGPHRQAIVAGLAAALGVESGAVSFKAKTNEGVDAVGRGEAMAAHATALLRQDHR